MKKIKNVLMASALVILSANVFAGPVVYGNYGVHSASQTIDTPAAQSKERAYSLGLEKLNALKSISGSELSDELSLPLGSLKEKNSITLDDGAYITVAELMNEQGEVVYKGLINVSYRYSQAN